MKIAFYQMRPFDEQAYIEQFSREFGIDYVTIPGAPCPENLDKAAGCDAVSQNPCEILPEYVEAWARMGVKYLLCRSIGYDHIPLETAKKLGMRVAHSHYPPEGVANYAIMLMLMCTRKMNQTMLRAAAQDYTLPGKMGKDLSNCTVGVIGTGKIGRTVIAHLQGFGCKILAYDLYQSDEVAQMAEYVPLDELYARSDVITLHTNATAENHHLINAESLAKMKDGVRIINLARGDLVDNAAVKAALASGKVACYVTDFPSDELLDVEGVIAIPHLGASTPESEENCASMAAAQLIDYLENGNIKNSVNYPATYMARSAANRIVVLHENVPTMLAQVLTVLSNDNINIENMVSCSKGNNACSLFDTDAKVSEKAAADIRAIQGVRRITVIEG